ncbi:MAG: tetraacyldisaccharide 4'-kinase, partial [Polynucleobacter sp. 24-46-87]
MSSKKQSSQFLKFNTAPQFWERRGPTSLLLWPLSWLYGLINRALDLLNEIGLRSRKPQAVPIIIVGNIRVGGTGKTPIVIALAERLARMIVGNIRVGGTGKTPIVIALAERLARMGWKPGIISRGYGASTSTTPSQVHSDSNPLKVGDEPVLIAKRTQDQFPIWVHPQRMKSIRSLLKKSPDVNVIISDDGLQHRALARWPAREGGRDIEFVVRDQRGEGNRFLLPAGPLREPASRDRDATLMTGTETTSTHADQYFLGRRAFHLQSTLGTPYQLINPSNTQPLDVLAASYSAEKVTAIAAIGNPQRFFDDLQKHGVRGEFIGL